MYEYLLFNSNILNLGDENSRKKKKKLFGSLFNVLRAIQALIFAT